MSHPDYPCNRSPDWVGSVWKKYSYRIYKLCLQKCATKDEADDLFQEVALRFCKKAGELNNEIHLLPWFNTVLLNCHYSGYRKKCLVREIPFSSLCESKSYYDASVAYAYEFPDECVNVESVRGEFSYLLKALNPLEKMIVELSVVGGLGLGELSRLVGLSRGSLIHRKLVALKKMQAKMVTQKERIKMITGREASLREILEFAG